MKRAIYPGSFDPISNGHMDVALRAAQLFDEVIIAVYEGSDKPGALFTTEERAELAREAVKDHPNICVGLFSGLTVDYARTMDARSSFVDCGLFPILSTNSSSRI